MAKQGSEHEGMMDELAGQPLLAVVLNYVLGILSGPCAMPMGFCEN